MAMKTQVLYAILPLLPPSWLLFRLVDNPLQALMEWIDFVVNKQGTPREVPHVVSTTGSQLLAYLVMAILGYIATFRLVPNIKVYMLRKNICGKDLGKRGTSSADKEIPEALGIAPGAIFLVCLIICLTSHPSKLLDLNSALLSICFMLFLGFTDDVLDWPWRYKLFLPSIASLPLLCCYNGGTSIVIPIPLRSLLMQNGKVTFLGNLLGNIITIDTNADGAIINLGILYLVYMGMLAVFCTNAINIYAGINGLEAGQSYVIGCAVLVHNLIEIGASSPQTGNHLFSVMVMMSFVGATLGLLRHNWYPASVFVGDTYCYFAGMVFAATGILGHFSKTLLLFFIPQVLNFLWSVPQLFKFVPCPRHRLPRFDPETGLMYPSTFPCKPSQFQWLKTRRDDTQVANMTLINVCLQILGPMTEQSLCLILLAFQVVCCTFGLWLRYYVAPFFFDS